MRLFEFGQEIGVWEPSNNKGFADNMSKVGINKMQFELQEGKNYLLREKVEENRACRGKRLKENRNENHIT